jgi:hypothetical protein
MTTIYTRATKGSALSWTEGDANITNLNTDKIELTDLSVSTATASSGGSLSYNDTTGVFTFTPADVSASGATTLDELTDVVITTPVTGQILIYDGADWINGDAGIDLTDLSVGTEGTASGDGSIAYDNTTGVFTYTPPTAAGIGALADIVADTTPQLGGSLDVNGNSIVSVSNGNISITPNGTGKTVISAMNYGEGAIYSIGTTSGTITPNATNGNVQTITLNGNLTLNAFASPVAGQSITLKIVQDATGSRTLTSTMKWAGGIKTLSTAANSIDIASIYYDGTNYFASLAKGFA